MILLIIFGSLFAAGLITAIICACIDKFHPEAYSPEWLQNTSVGVAVVSGLVLICMSAGILCTQINIDMDYDNTAEKREALVMAVELAEEGNVTLTNVNIYTDIAKFNAELRKVKRWADNPWINLFYNHRIAHEIDYIRLPE